EANALNQQAKNFFGTLYFSYIKALSDGSIVEDQNLAGRVDTLIERIGTVTLSSGDRIIAAEDAYAALSDVQKSLVKNYEKLTSARKDYDNLRMDISSASITGIKTGYVYTRSAICPVPKVVVNKKVLKSGTDYELSYSNNKNVGTATVTITAKDGSGYRGAFIKNFNIVKDSIGDGSLTGIKKKYKYTGSKIRPVPTLRVNGKKLKKGTDYKVSYSRNKKVGVASVTLKGIGNYKGSKTKTFNIVRASNKKSARLSQTPAVRILSDATLSELQAAVTAYQSRLTAHAISTDFSSYTTEAEMIDAMKKALARMLIYDISNQLGMVIISSEFQNSFYTLIEEYDKLLSLGVVSYAATSDIDPNGYLSCYSDLTTMYSYLNTSLIRIYNASQMSLSANNLVTFYSSVYEGDDSVYLAVSKYRDKYTEMASKDKFKKCLLDNDTTNLEYYMYYMLSDFPLNSAYLSAYGFDGVATGDYYEMYEKLMLRYMLEKSYSNLSYTPSDNTSMRSNFSKFEESGNSYTVPGMYVLYTRLCGYDKIWSQADVYGLGSRTAAESFIKSQLYGSDILQIIREYEDIKSFLVELDSLSASAGQGSSSDVKKAVDVYTKYTKLTESEKSKLSANDITLLNACKPVMSKIDDVVTKIKSITYPTTQAIYKSTFLVKYQAALSAYEALLKLYPNSGIEVFVENRLKLTDEYKTYKTYQDKINDALAIDPVNVCFKLKTVIEPLKAELEKLSVSNTTVFNKLIDYNKFTALHTDATAASALRLRVDALMLSPSSEDSTEIANIRSAVNALNANAKKYFGTLYDQYLQALEYGTYTEDINRSGQVDSLISKIGTVNINSGPSIIEAEEAYDALTTMQKSLVKTYATLVAARQTYNSLRLSLSAASVSGIKTGYVYTHARIKPGPVVVLEGVTLKAGVDYTISYSNNKNVGTATVTLTAVDGSGYKGEYHKTFKIVKDSVKDCGISGMKASYKYTGKKVKPKPVVRVNGYKLKKGTDYKLVYSNNKNKGIATLKIKGIGNYKGSRIITFNIKK
ncbi:MAG: hypothetical protein J6P16_03285, partial [Eubacterium sp.]|nr:hypothetical protein [Eubacterium sp.]